MFFSPLVCSEKRCRQNFVSQSRNQDFEIMISFFLFLLAVVVFYIGKQIVHALRKIGLELEILRGKREKDD